MGVRVLSSRHRQPQQQRSKCRDIQDKRSRRKLRVVAVVVVVEAITFALLGTDSGDPGGGRVLFLDLPFFASCPVGAKGVSH